MDPKLIVLTPVKNEAWILHQYLLITSLFADCIIVADQNSTDESKFICGQFPKVKLIENKACGFNEAERQIILIAEARKLYPDCQRILFGLDADELFSSNSLFCNESWARITTAPPGTTIYFEKPDILPGVKKCIRHRQDYFPIGYVDDGMEHTPKPIHSKRIPGNDSGKKLLIEDIKILHFALSRRNVQSAKHRYYSVIENLEKINPLYLRRRLYKSFYDEHKWYHLKSNETINQDWLKEWDKKNINIRDLADPEFSWQDFEVLKLFKKYGYEKFRFENIWKFNWEKCRQEALIAGKEAPCSVIKKPGFMVRTGMYLLDLSYNAYNKLKSFTANKPVIG